MIGDARAPTDVPSHDFFLDLPHPNASDKSLPNGRMIIGAPPQNFTDSETVCKELTTEKNLGHITRLAFPDYSDKYHGKKNYVYFRVHLQKLLLPRFKIHESESCRNLKI